MPTEDCSPGFARQMTEINGQNAKNSLDAFAEISRQGVMDNQAHARQLANLHVREAEGFATLKYLATAGLLQLGQAGAVEDQTATGAQDTANAGVAVAAEGTAVAAQTVATSLGNLLTASVGLITATGGVVTAQSLAAILPILVNAIGGASTPSQTQAKPAGAPAA